MDEGRGDRESDGQEGIRRTPQIRLTGIERAVEDAEKVARNLRSLMVRRSAAMEPELMAGVGNRLFTLTIWWFASMALLTPNPRSRKEFVRGIVDQIKGGINNVVSRAEKEE